MCTIGSVSFDTVDFLSVHIAVHFKIYLEIYNVLK